MITKQEAISLLNYLANNELFNDELSYKLRNVANGLRYLRDFGMDVFGVKGEEETELEEMYLSVSDQTPDEIERHQEKCRNLLKKYGKATA